MNTRTVSILALSTMALLAFSGGCMPKDSQHLSLIESSTEPPGSHCALGGVRFESGVDWNGNGILEQNEVDNVSWACSQRVDGFTSRIRTTPEPPGANCEWGGDRIETGLDTNENGQLDDSEVDETAFACQGEPGTDGTNGRDGEDGIDGFTTLVTLTNLPPDPNGACYFGGTQIASGLDRDRDGVLDDDEVAEVQQVCSVHVNENLTLVENKQELPGENCEFGGVHMLVGYDDDNDRILDPEEVDGSTYLCNEVILIPGETSLFVSRDATVAECPHGGYLFSSGLDHNYDNVLSPSEVTDTALVCNGVDGFTGLVESAPYSGAECSEQGGYIMTTGLDLDYDGILDPGEVEATSIICNGQDGFLGYDGKNSLVRVTDAGSTCPEGGFQFEVGLDQNENGVLDASEVQSREYICDGSDGGNSLIAIWDDGGFCPNGGSRIEVGLDDDGDGYLDHGEVDQATYVCDGYDGFTPLIDMYDASYSVCPYGGVVIEAGLDTDFDGYLDAGEVEVSSYVCDGYDGYSSLIEMYDASYSVCPYGGVVIETGLDLDGDGYLDYNEVESAATICN